MSYKRIWALLLICVHIVMVACSSPSNYTGEVIDNSNLLESSEALDEALIYDEFEIKKKDIEKHYAGDLVFQDFSESKLRLDEEYEARLTEQFKENMDRPFKIKVDMEYYNSSLKQAQDEGWSIDRILEEPTEHIRTLKYDFIYPVLAEETNTPTLYFSELLMAYEEMNYHEIHLRRVSIKPEASISSTFETITLETLDWDMIAYILEESNRYTAVKKGSEVEEILKRFEVKYNQKFEWITNYTETVYGRGGTFAPANDLSIQFATNKSDQDKYLTAMAQKYLYDLVYEILVEEGVEDRIIPLAIPKHSDSKVTDLNGYDITSIKTREDILRFLNYGFYGDYNLVLINLKDPSDEIDYESIRRVTAKMSEFITVTNAENIDSRITKILVETFDLERDKIPVALTLFKKDVVCSAHYNPEVILSNVYALAEVTREEIDAFHYLDVYGNKLDGLLYIGGRSRAEIESMTADEYEMEFYRDSKY